MISTGVQLSNYSHLSKSVKGSRHWHGGDAQRSGCAISQATRPRRDEADTADTADTEADRECKCRAVRCAAVLLGVLTQPNQASHRQAHPKPRCRLM